MRTLAPPILLLVLASTAASTPDPAPGDRLTAGQLAAAGEVAGLAFTDRELELMLEDASEQLADYESTWEHPLPNSVPPTLVFDPWAPFGARGTAPRADVPDLVLREGERPADLAELLWADIPTLASLIRSRRVSCRELVELSLARLREIDGTLHCVITLTEERGRARAEQLDAELERGQWRGPLHGIPWGAKDLLAARDYPTTWGAGPFRDQVLDLDAAVVERLDEAGAVLVAKLTLGELAWGDVWFGEKTRNPWNPEQGASGSSAGSAAAVVAGGVVFSIGSETLGSIVSPSERCGASSLRPSFGRVSRHGAMALSWSMDKLGPLCRSVRDAALVFEAIHGRDPRDAATRDVPFAAGGPVDVSDWRVGYPADAFDGAPELAPVLDRLEALGVDLVALDFPQELPVQAMLNVLTVEAAAAFDELTRSGRDDELVRQVRHAWPNVFRASRLVPAVEYLRANRLRWLLSRQVEAALAEVDAYVHPSFAAGVLSATNLTGHPTVVAPAGFRDDGTPFGVSFTARLDGEERLLSLASAWQESTDHHRAHPDLQSAAAEADGD